MQTKFPSFGLEVEIAPFGPELGDFGAGHDDEIVGQIYLLVQRWVRNFM